MGGRLVDAKTCPEIKCRYVGGNNDDAGKFSWLLFTAKNDLGQAPTNVELTIARFINRFITNCAMLALLPLGNILCNSRY